VDTKDPIIVDILRLDNSGWVQWQNTPTGPMMPPAKIDVWPDQRYQVRVRKASCDAWSEWIPKVVPPSNPCGACNQPVSLPSIPVTICTNVVFTGEVTDVEPVSIPAGTYRVDVETKDANHQLGYQTDQTQEVVTIDGIGTTEDIPEADTAHVTTFFVTLPAQLGQVVIHGGRDSVHGLCITFTKQE